MTRGDVWDYVNRLKPLPKAVLGLVLLLILAWLVYSCVPPEAPIPPLPVRPANLIPGMRL